MTKGLETAPVVQAAFRQDHILVLGTGAQGGAIPGLGTLALPETVDSSSSWTVNTRGLGGPLLVGLLDSTSFGSGFQSLEFKITENGVMVVDDTFSTASAAQNFFHDRVLNLGNFSSTLPLNLTFDLALTATTIGTGTGFGELFVFGADPPIATPEPNSLWLLLLGIGLVGVGPLWRARRVRHPVP